MLWIVGKETDGIGNTMGISYTPYFKVPEKHGYEVKNNKIELVDFKAQLKKDDEYFKEQIKRGFIKISDYKKLKFRADKIISEDNGLIFSGIKHNAELDILKSDYLELKKNILVKSGIELSKDKMVVEASMNVYRCYGIDQFTYRNGNMKQFVKGIFDGVMVGNYELALKLYHADKDEIFGILDSIFSVQGIYEIIKSVGLSLKEIAVGDPYQRGKCLSEMGIIAIGSGLAGAMIKGGGKVALKIGASRGIKTLELAGKGLQKAGNAIQSPYHASNAMHERMTGSLKKIASESIGKIPAVKKLTSAAVIHEATNPHAVEETVGRLKHSESLSVQEKHELISKMEQNNPVLSILTKLKRGDHFENIIFTGIKELNDVTSQAFVDKVMYRFKKEVINRHGLTDVVWDDYKNFLVKTKKGMDLDGKKLQQLLSDILHDELGKSEYVGKVNNPSLKVHNKKGVISGRNQEEIMNNIALNRKKLEKETKGGTVMTGSETIRHERKLCERCRNTGGEEIMSYSDIQKTVFVKDNVLYEKIGQVQGRDRFLKTKIFERDGSLSIDFITKVRKKELPIGSEIYIEFKKVLDGYSANGEFIAPYIKEKGLPAGTIVSPETLRNYSDLKNRIASGRKLNGEQTAQAERLATHSYKNALDKVTYYHRINKPGELIFVDIKDMGSINIGKDYRNNIQAWYNDIGAEEEVLKKGEKSVRSENRIGIMKNSGDLMTSKFQHIVKELDAYIGRLYPDKARHVYIGGDEISIFIEGVGDPAKLNQIKLALFRLLDKHEISGRVTSRDVFTKDLAIGGEKLVESIDKLTKSTKSLEKRFAEIERNLRLKVHSVSAIDMTSQKLLALGKIKDFSIELGNDDVGYIIFHNNPIENSGNRFPLNSILDKNGDLKESILTQYLDEKGIGRSRRAVEETETDFKAVAN